MTKSQNMVIMRIASSLAFLLAAAIALYAINLLMVGEMRMVVLAVPQGAPQEPPQLIRVPYPPAIIPLIAATLLLGGLVMRWLPVAWLGQALLSMFAVLFLFSSGGQLLPTAGLLLVLLTLLQTRNVRLAWVIVLFLLAAGVSLWFGSFWLLLPLAVLLVLLLLALQHQQSQAHSRQA